MSISTIFDSTLELPTQALVDRAKALIGFDDRFTQIHFNLKLLLDPGGLSVWSQKYHQQELPILRSLTDRHPLIILEGDAGTGKTVSAEVIANKMLIELGKTGFFMKLSTRVRGDGVHGQMAKLVNQAFEELKKVAGQKRIAFLFIDEADAIATTRATAQMHQEEKAAVNTLIQKIDDTRELVGRAIVFLATNRLHFLDEAIVRRAAVIMKFERPTEKERKALLTQELTGVQLSAKEIDELVSLTSAEQNDGVGFSFSDLRLRLLPAAIALAYPDGPLTFKLLRQALAKTSPSPQIK
ncbi:ATP-binding protein (plasmid) [Hymenobacter tibetensis]|uniref:ATP-binding protein n=1 Tax=Hymenobacter tibetensis TaxID=497967 RepID=A0ABY4D4P5_9BACT|nr:ATP-binding protein [Hymenobacter tibetensis]UOG77420.1 ATP-binding protein [Hymenobacter tibetensis]